MKRKLLKYKGIPISPIVLFKTILNDENKTLDKVLDNLEKVLRSLINNSISKLETSINNINRIANNANNKASDINSDLKLNYFEKRDFCIINSDNIIRLYDKDVYNVLRIYFTKYNDIQYLGYKINNIKIKSTTIDKFDIEDTEDYYIIDKETKERYIHMTTDCFFALKNSIPKSSNKSEYIYLTVYDVNENKDIDIHIEY